MRAHTHSHARALTQSLSLSDYDLSIHAISETSAHTDIACRLFIRPYPILHAKIQLHSLKVNHTFRCVNGAPPIFQVLEKVRGEVTLAGFPEEGGEDAVRQALADLLGVDVSQIVLPDQSRRHARRGTSRAIVFEILGDASQVASLTQIINSGNMASQLSSQLSDQYGMEITVEVSGNQVAQTSEKRPEGEEWVMVGGEYFLRACPRGFILVNTTVETQECRECAVGSFNIDPLRGCTSMGSTVRCDARPCSGCPEGVDCSSGSAPVWSHFVPKPLHLGENVYPWVTVVQPSGNRSRLFCDGTKKTCAPPDLANTKQAISAIPIEDLEHHLWEEVDGVFELRKCPPGFKLINTSIELQKCSPCGKGKYIIEGSTDCVDCPVFSPAPPPGCILPLCLFHTHLLSPSRPGRSRLPRRRRIQAQSRGLGLDGGNR